MCEDIVCGWAKEGESPSFVSLCGMFGEGEEGLGRGV